MKIATRSLQTLASHWHLGLTVTRCCQTLHWVFIDHSRPGTAKWCSMSTCGNRMKVRAHARRTRRG